MNPRLVPHRGSHDKHALAPYLGNIGLELKDLGQHRRERVEVVGLPARPQHTRWWAWCRHVEVECQPQHPYTRPTWRLPSLQAFHGF